MGDEEGINKVGKGFDSKDFIKMVEQGLVDWKPSFPNNCDLPVIPFCDHDVKSIDSILGGVYEMMVLHLGNTPHSAVNRFNRLKEIVKGYITWRMKITDENRAIVLAALYNASCPQGMGWLHYDKRDMTITESYLILSTGVRQFDYLRGRVMKVDLGKEYPDFSLYDRDNGVGAAMRATNGLEVE